MRVTARVVDLPGEEKAFRPSPVECRPMTLDAELVVEPRSALEGAEGLVGTAQPGQDQSAQGQGLGEPHRNISGAAQLDRPLAQDEGLRELALDHELAGKEAREHGFGDRIQVGPLQGRIAVEGTRSKSPVVERQKPSHAQLPQYTGTFMPGTSWATGASGPSTMSTKASMAGR